MATRNIVPRATGEGSIGTPEKKWNSASIKNINAESIDIDNLDVENLDATNLDVENLDATNLDVENLDVHSESVSPVNTLQRGTTYAADDIVYTSKLNAKYYLLCITGGTTGSVEPSFVGAGSNTEVTDGTAVWRVQTITSQEKAAGFPIGFEYFQTNPNVPAGSLPMLGGVYSRDTYADLWAWVQTQTGYLITDSAWQALSNTQNGNVPFYSSGDGSTTFRVPSLKCWVKGANGTVSEVGSYLAAGLPNITGQVYGFNGTGMNIGLTGGAFTIAKGTPRVTGGSSYGYDDLHFDFNASRSNSIYGNSDTVVPESIIGMWLVKAYGTIVDIGQIDEQAYIDEQLALNVPVGCVQTYAGQTTPQGWLLCDGSAISRTQYNRLFGVIGTTYGVGDGTDTFNLPNLIDNSSTVQPPSVTMRYIIKY